LCPYFIESDFLDIKIIQSRANLLQFIAAMLSQYPWWVVFLYRLRSLLVYFLGLVRHKTHEVLPKLNPEDISFTAACVLTRLSERLSIMALTAWSSRMPALQETWN